MAKRKPVASSSTPSLFDNTVAFARDYAPTASMTLLAVTGFWYADAATPVLNLLTSWTPVVGASLNNIAGQITVAAAESALAVGALKSGLWGFGRIRKASELEKQNTALLGQLDLANKALAKDESEKEKELKLFEKALKKEATNLRRKQTILTKAKNSIEYEKSQLDIKKTKLESEKEDLKKARIEVIDEKKTTATKAHDVAKNQAEKERKLNKLEATLVKREKELETKELALSKKVYELNVRELELQARKNAVEDNISESEVDDVAAEHPSSLPAAGITVAKSLTSSFDRLRSKEKSLIPGTPPAEEASASSEKVRNRSPSPGIVH